MNKIISHLHIFFKKLNQFIIVVNLLCPFIAAESTTWIFFIFWPSKIYVSLTEVVSSLSSPRCCLCSDRRCHVVALCHTSFPWRQDEFTASALSFGNASSRRLPSRAETKTVNPHHRRWSPSPDCSTPILHCYKKTSQSWPLFSPLNNVSILSHF
jgi:hypothetical protein